MREAVDEVIALRAQDPDGLRRMITWSFAVHVGVLVLIAVLPRLGLFQPKPPAPVMMISLADARPRSTGMTPVAARPVEEVAPEPKRQTPVPVAAAEARRDDGADEAAGQAAQAGHEAGDHSPARPRHETADDGPPGADGHVAPSRRARAGLARGSRSAAEAAARSSRSTPTSAVRRICRTS